jgi:hypothetical protein
MAAPPGDAHSLKGSDQIFNGSRSQDGGLWTGGRGEVGTGDGDIAELAAGELDVAVPEMARQVGHPNQR